MRPLPVSELDEAVDRLDWSDLRGARLFVTGGTGFFGLWLMEVLARAEDRHRLGVQALVLTRDPSAFRRAAPHLADHPSIRAVGGDVVDFTCPSGSISHVLHAATSTSAARGGPESPARLTATVVDGTRRVVELALDRGVERLLYVSSGAVHGRQPPELTHLPEGFSGAPDPLDPRSTYGIAKRLAEHLCARETAFATVVARAFAFVGPHLPLDQHYAIGNFLADGLAGRPIVVRGDGTAWRSYLYAGDLAAWLWTLLLRAPASSAVHVGSDQGLPLGELARRVGGWMGVPVEILGRPGQGPPERYVPEVARARALGLEPWTSLEEAVARTARWHRGG